MAPLQIETDTGRPNVDRVCKIQAPLPRSWGAAVCQSESLPKTRRIFVFHWRKRAGILEATSQVQSNTGLRGVDDDARAWDRALGNRRSF